MPAVVVIATLRPAPGKAAELRVVLDELIPAVHEETGCTLYALHDNPADGSLVFVERYATAEDYDAHRAGVALAQHGPRLGALLASEVEVCVLTPVPLGNARKGTV